MNGARLRIVVLGLSITSSWGNGHATTYRALVKGLARRGHEVLFLERDVPWYAANRDLPHPPYGRTVLYRSIEDLRSRHEREVREADLVMVGSYVPDGIAVGDWVLGSARGVTAFYDIDTPVTLSNVKAGTCAYLSPGQISRYSLYLSFTSGPTLRRLASCYGARCARALYCSVDAEIYRPCRSVRQWDVGYLGTYSCDRQSALELLLFEPARRMPHLRFVVAGAQYPSSIDWPANVHHVPHISPADHPRFYSSLRWSLNVTRADMVKAGHSPSVRLFEAAASGVPIISDRWAGLRQLLRPGREIVVASSPLEVIEALTMPDPQRRRIAAGGRRRILAQHTSQHRAAEIEAHLLAAIDRKRARRCARRNRFEVLTFPGRTG